MTPSKELEALGFCAATLAKVEFLRNNGRDVSGGSEAPVLVRVEILGFHPVVAGSLASAVEQLQRDVDAYDARQKKGPTPCSS